jgi:hypothetical protein
LASSKIEWVIPDAPGFLGVRVQWSTDPSGIAVPYVQMGDLVTTVVRSDNNVVTSFTQTAQNGSTRTTTTTESLLQVNYSSMSFARADVGNADLFYVVLSTVIQDPDTNHVYESNYNGPFVCGFVDLRTVSPADFITIQQKEEIASRLISSALANYPDLDLTPRSELRDLHIDPISLELSQQSVREWFARCSQSISALATLDDYDGDGLSDDINSSPYKPLLARAWGLNASDLQILIDRQFDILGEGAGLTRGGAISSVVLVTIYTYTRPQSSITLNASELQVGSISDADTSSLTFYGRGSAQVGLSSIDSIYDPIKGWWGVTLPFECAVPGTVGNVGAGTIKQALAGVPSGWNVINLSNADYGINTQSNAKFAEMIRNRQIVGIDSGRRLGYLNTALGTPSVVDANVVASGDLEMLRDWDPLRKKHIFGTTDVYVRGTNFSQNTEYLSFQYQNGSATYRSLSSYVQFQLVDRKTLALKVSTTLPFNLYTVVELIAQRNQDQFYLGTKLAKIDSVNNIIYLEPTEQCYKLIGDAVSESTTTFLLNGHTATNQAAINYLSNGSVQFRGWIRLQSPLALVPQLQPVSVVYSVVGEDTRTGTVSPSITRLITSQDPLLEGFSDRASDRVQIDTTTTSTLVQTLHFVTAGPSTLPLDTNVSVTVDQSGTVGNVLSVRSADASTLYVFGRDYRTVVLDRYKTIGIQRVTTGTIPLDVDVLVAYNKDIIHEYCSLVSNESVPLNGTSFSPLSRRGFVTNVWLSESYGITTISMDGWNSNPLSYTGLTAALVPKQSRYIKVTYDNGSGPVVMREGQDFVLQVVGDQASISRIVTGRVPDGTNVLVSYVVTEDFAVTSGYPGFVSQVASEIETTRHTGADVLVKAMIQNAVDVNVTVELDSSVTPEAMDNRIRTVIGIVLDNAKGKVTQAEVIRQIKSIQGILNVQVPLTKFAKSDGSYDIGIILPTGTEWIPIAQDSQFNDRQFPPLTFITKDVVLPDSTIPSGGLRDSYVGLLYEGEAYTRALSIGDFQTKTSKAFYIIGIDDQIDPLSPILSSYAGKVIISIPSDLQTPSANSFKVTFQVWKEGGAKDIILSPTEYLRAGRVTISYR